MAAPTLVDAWFTRGEVSMPATADLQAVQRSWLWMLKAALTNDLTGGTTSGTRGGSSNWTVAGSSNGSAAGMDAVDRWGASFTPANLVRAPEGTAHSWIVLQSPAALGLWMCINYNGSSEGAASISIARAAFSGGSTTTKPTASAETAVGTSSVGGAINMAAIESVFGVAYRFGFSVNTDGELHAWVNRVGTGLFWGYLNVIRLRSQTAGDAWPVISTCHFSASGRGAGQPSTIWSPSICAFRTPSNSARVSQGGVKTHYYGNQQVEGSLPINTLKALWDAFDLDAETFDAGSSGARGKLQDIYQVGNPAVGGSFPTVGTQTMMVIGGILIPSGVPVAL